MKTTYMNLIILNLFPSVLATETSGNHFLKILQVLVSLSGTSKKKGWVTTVRQH
jgi:hypothetical protein